MKAAPFRPDERVVACHRVADLADAPGSVVRRCCQCGAPVWVRPTNLDGRRLGCRPCCAEAASRHGGSILTTTAASTEEGAERLAAFAAECGGAVAGVVAVRLPESDGAR